MNRIRTLMWSATIIATAALADTPQDVVVRGSQPTRSASADERAIQACANAFIARILPGRSKPVAIHVPSSRQIFNVQSELDVRMDVDLIANSARSRTALASARCVVNAAARIDTFRVRIQDAAALAALDASELRLAVAEH